MVIQTRHRPSCPLRRGYAYSPALPSGLPSSVRAFGIVRRARLGDVHVYARLEHDPQACGPWRPLNGLLEVIGMDFYLPNCITNLAMEPFSARECFGISSGLSNTSAAIPPSNRSGWTPMS
jgi:hypothetical protein